MNEWHRMVQQIVDEIDLGIKSKLDEKMTLTALSQRLGYSEFLFPESSMKFPVCGCGIICVTDALHLRYM